MEEGEVGRIERFDVYPPSEEVKECTLHYENFDVEDIYKQWDELVPQDRVQLMERFVQDFALYVHEYAQQEAGGVEELDLAANGNRGGKGSLHHVANQSKRRQGKATQSSIYGKVLKRCMKKHRFHPRKAMVLHTYRKLVSSGKLARSILVEQLLVTKSSKSDSGVLVITVLTSPYPKVNGKTQRFSCKWNCYYCPDQPGQPRSYLRDEPAVLRANQNGFDPVLQFVDRAATLAQNGHPVDKVELLVLGGTWCSYPYAYQQAFIRDLFYAANTFSFFQAQTTKRERLSLLEEQQLNEHAKCKIIGITLETRPDTITDLELQRFRYFGCTRIQLGVQHTSDSILKKINRQSTLADTKRAIRLLKEACFKIDIHLMPNLPGSCPADDDKMFTQVLDDPDLQVDQWKIYPCEVTPWSVIEKWQKNGSYKPYGEELLMQVIIRVKEKVHPWIRLNRVIRDIPNTYIIDGMSAPNLRQVIADRMKAEGKKCHCIRCREIGSARTSKEEAVLIERVYTGSGATEIFLSFENSERTAIFGFLRLRLPSSEQKDICFPELNAAGLVRELHVYGKLIKTGQTKDKVDHAQHVGFGRRLMERAEQICASHGLFKVAVISGVGTREYYRRLGYSLDTSGKGHFMIKHLSEHLLSMPTAKQFLLNKNNRYIVPLCLAAVGVVAIAFIRR